ncbi:splicing factor SF1 [Ephemerocybe angulata]|uniref:Branchpoint-bridging protein n=1 Tax=Ephemerocybe angulata TaxID=980116 RepID=A0A8H6M655_9AGAR|nr:splicing factor SF1 [Tulosesus angulatus]
MWKPATRQITGTNDVPLGTRRRFGPAPAEDNHAPQLAQPSPSVYPRQQSVDRESSVKRGRDDSPITGDPKLDPNAPRKRRSRWGEAKTEIPGLPTAIFCRRSPSPPPTYDSQGRRTNTREVRYRKKLEEERVRLVERAMKNDPNFRPPVEYHQQKRSQRPSDKVYIPVKEFPEINFFGLLVGPRGNSLKKMERESGAKISIRGKGSVKEGKARPDQFADDAEEDLHCLVIAESDEKVAACVKMINRVIETAASTPEGQNDHKRNQLRELAALNGTLRDDENQICQNCGGVGHRKYDCPEQRNFTANIICRVCGSAGHMARDCQVNRDPNAPPPPPGGPPTNRGGFDSEYASLMAELGETPAANDPNKNWSAPTMGGHDITAGGTNIPPWRRPEVWAQQAPPPQQQQYRPPQGGYGGYPGASGGYGDASSQWQGYGGQAAAGYGGQGQDYSNYAAYYQGQYTQQQMS